jgi:polysaccharide deacetylase family protein (PEP-CTERM system associated)
VAEAYPELVREVARRGHEVASHTHRHRLIFHQTRAGFYYEMEKTMKLLQDLTGQPIRGFRAPEFSVGSISHWCFEVIKELGFAYDSSVFPVGSARYGIAKCPRTPFRIDTPSGSLMEFPIASWQLLGKPVAMGGGTYFRFLPIALLRRIFNDLERQHYPAVLYFHPYEFHDSWLHLGWKPRPVYLKYLILHNFTTSLSITSSLRHPAETARS